MARNASGPFGADSAPEEALDGADVEEGEGKEPPGKSLVTLTHHGDTLSPMDSKATEEVMNFES